MAFLINIWYTAKGKLGDIHADIAAKFVFTGTIMYFFVSIQGSMMSLPDVQRVTHFNNWVVGHAHIGVLGFAGMIAVGGLYHVLPLILKRPVYSLFLADLQYWLMLIGISGFCRGADHRGADTGQCMAQWRNRIPGIAANPYVLRGQGRPWA